MLILHGTIIEDMERPFVYDRYVTGKNFVGRKTECNALANLLSSKEHVTLYEPPKAGKTSLIQQTLFNMRLGGSPFMVASLDMFNVRTVEDMLLKFASAVVRPVMSTPDEYRNVVESYLADTHFIFDRRRFDTDGEVVSLGWDIDSNDIERMLMLPEMIARDKGIPYYVIVNDFQNIMKDDRYEDVFKALERIFQNVKVNERNAVFILTGSAVNAMKYIFEEYKYFYRMVEHLPLPAIEDTDIIDYVIKGFQPSGKVIPRDLVIGACRLFRCEMWYMNHFTYLCDSMTRGFLNEGILMEALKAMISIHEPRFKSIVNDLTGHQLSLVRAILDGVVKFSSSEVIERYGLNSSANVRRVKDALKKKEVITFNEKDEPVILDPLLEYWLINHYFEIK